MMIAAWVGVIQVRFVELFLPSLTLKELVYDLGIKLWNVIHAQSLHV